MSLWPTLVTVLQACLSETLFQPEKQTTFVGVSDKFRL